MSTARRKPAADAFHPEYVDLGSLGRGLVRRPVASALAALVAAGTIVAWQLVTGPTFESTALVYIGHAVGPDDELFTPVENEPVTVLERTSDPEWLAASAADDVEADAIRQGLSVRPVQSPAASRLSAPPELVRITMRAGERSLATDVAERAALSVVTDVNEYATERHETLVATAADQRRSVESLRTQVAAATKAARSAPDSTADTWAVLVATLQASLDQAEADLADTDALLPYVSAVERARVVQPPTARRIDTPNWPLTLAVAALLALVAATITAAVLDRRRDH